MRPLETAQINLRTGENDIHRRVAELVTLFAFCLSAHKRYMAAKKVQGSSKMRARILRLCRTNAISTEFVHYLVDEFIRVLVFFPRYPNVFHATFLLQPII